MMKQWMIWGGVLAIALAGCSGAPTNTETAGGKGTESTGGTAPTGKTLTIGMVLDTGGLGDKSFNDSAYAGLTRAETELGIKKVYVQSKDPGEYETNIEQLAAQNSDLVIAVGLGMEELVARVAPKYPNVKFAVVDGNAQGDNVRGLKFREEQGSFLAGYLAGLVTKTNKIGFVGGMEIDLIRKFQYGYAAGARMANPNITVLPAKFTLSWDSQDKGKAFAASLYGEGADVVFHAAGRAGLGVFRAAKDAGKLAIGVDSDQDDVIPGTVLTSMIKRVDQAVYQTIQDVKDGKFTGGNKEYDLASDGVGLSDMRHSKTLVTDDMKTQIKSIRDKIVSGEIKVPATEAEYETFVAGLN